MASISSRPRCTLVKRTRRNVVQSKNGCLTCRSRRKKCDETLPFCINCQLSAKQCDGYSYQAIQRLIVPQQGEAEEHRLVKICFDVLHHGQYGGVTRNSPWLQLLVPVAHTSNVVRASMALFGAVCSSSKATVPPQVHNISLRRRQLALCSIRKDLAAGSPDAISLFLACSVLAASEALFGDLASALLHAQAAFKIIDLYSSQVTPDQACASGKPSLTGSPQLTETLYTLALSMDMHSASYRLSQPPDMPARYPTLENRASLESCAASDFTTLCVIHSCYHFTAYAHRFKYDLAAAHLESLLTEQSRHLAALRSRLGTINKAELGLLSGRTLMLRAQCLSSLIYVSAILNPRETYYDKHEKDFIGIVQTCNELLTRSSCNALEGGTRYQFEPGIIQPCYLTTMKCRHPIVRRQARSILSRLGREGPWDGQLLAAVACHAIELEEKFGHPISERDRIHGCSIFTADTGVVTFDRTREVEFSLCDDLKDMLGENDSDNLLRWIFVRKNVLVDSGSS